MEYTKIDFYNMKAEKEREKAASISQKASINFECLSFEGFWIFTFLNVQNEFYSQYKNHSKSKRKIIPVFFQSGK